MLARAQAAQVLLCTASCVQKKPLLLCELCSQGTANEAMTRLGFLSSGKQKASLSWHPQLFLLLGAIKAFHPMFQLKACLVCMPVSVSCTAGIPRRQYCLKPQARL